MRVGAAIVIASGLVAASCAREEGVVITIVADPPIADGAGKLELFLGGIPEESANRRRFRQVLDPTASDDLMPIDGDLDGFTIFLDGTSSDVRLAAVAVFSGDPDEPADLPIALGMAPIELVKGELTEVEAFIGPTNDRVDRGSVRVRGPAAVPDGPAFSCLAWTDPGIATFEAIVRDEDYDCDGTLPVGGCSDPFQADFRVPDDLPDEDRDGDGISTCELCPDPNTGESVPCDCNDDPTTGGGAQHIGRQEVCDGVDNDCDQSTGFATDAINYAPCIQSIGGGGCTVGVFGCNENQPFAESAEACQDAITLSMEPCDINFDSCDGPATCDIRAGVLGQAIRCSADAIPEACLGSVPLLELIDDLDPTSGSPPPALTCTAVLWGADDLANGWSARLTDPVNPIGTRAIIEKPCVDIHLTLITQGFDTTEPFGVVIVVVEKETGKRYTIPVGFVSSASTVCGPLQCTGQ
jgi:hypothetical protein